MIKINPASKVIWDLELFLSSAFQKQNKWLGKPGFEIYVRLSRRIICEQRVWCLDIANISQHEKYIGKGYLKKFMLHVEKQNSYYTHIYMENVFNEKLAQMLTKNGYQLHKAADPPSYWKVTYDP